ncbi:MAG: preprotein translocase subunit SecE [Bacilli bacterium]|nr:preprotein translocase subunit SecE [Bacilli bacterium]
MEKQTKKVTKKKTVAKDVKEEKVLKEKDTKKKTTGTKKEKVENNKKNVKTTKKDNKPKKEKKESFFKGVKSEMSKVVWPTKKNMVKYSIATLVFIIFFALYFYGIEVIMAWLKSIIVVM